MSLRPLAGPSVLRICGIPIGRHGIGDGSELRHGCGSTALKSMTSPVLTLLSIA